MKNLLQSKKAKILAGTMLVNLVLLYLGPEWVDTAVKVLTALGMTYIGGQSLADGLSKGATSSAHASTTETKTEVKPEGGK